MSLCVVLYFSLPSPSSSSSSSSSTSRIGPFDPFRLQIYSCSCQRSSVFQLFSFPLVCSGMISKGFGFVAFLASVKASSVCIHLSCLVCLQSVLYAYTYFQFWRFRFFSNYFKNSVTYEKSVFYISCIVDLLLQLFC